MKAKKHNSFKAREKVLDALSTSSLNKLTADEILMALKEEGVESLEGLVTNLIEIVQDPESLDSQSPGRINLQLLSGQTPKKRVSTIVHRVPKIPFIVDGIEYDPKDIRRFDGRELHFVVGGRFVTQDAMLAFEDRSILTNWLQIIYLSRLAGLKVAPTSPSLSSDIGTLTHGPAHPPPPDETHVVYTPIIWGESSGPVEATMYEHMNFGGAALRLYPGHMWPDLRRVRRYFLWDWDNAVSSLYKSSSLCAYWDDVNLQGGIRVVIPNTNIFDLGYIGFDECISSAINFG